MLHVLKIIRQYLGRKNQNIGERKRFVIWNFVFMFIIPVIFPPDIFAKAGRVSYQRDGEEFAKSLIKEVKARDLEDILENKEKLKEPKGEGIEGEGCNNCVQNIENPENLAKKIEAEMGGKEEEILVFVSFSMPDIALKELFREARKYNAKLILRGIHEGSFKKTAEKILEIEEKGMSLEIDPKLFKRYGIRKVPTFVLVEGGEEVARLSGNVTLEYAKTELEKA